MRTKVNKLGPEVMLSRVLDGLALELLGASDAEIAQTAQDLRMDLSMPDSAAYAGVTYFAKPRMDDFFDLRPKDPEA